MSDQTVLTAIRAAIADDAVEINGYPSYDEVADRVGFCTRRVAKRLRQLEREDKVAFDETLDPTTGWTLNTVRPLEADDE